MSTKPSKSPSKSSSKPAAKPSTKPRPVNYDYTWMQADRIHLLGHPVPGTFGVQAMRAMVQMALNEPPDTSTAFIGYNDNHSILIILHVHTDGRVSVTKEYAAGKGTRFDLSQVLRAKRQRLHDVALALLEELLSSLITPEKTKPAT